MLKLPHLLVAFISLAVAGIAHGLLTERWQRSPILEKAVAGVAEVPLAFGDWQGKELDTEEASFAQAGAQGYWMRQYTHARQKTTLLVILMCGRSGRMAVHTPEVCYQGAGYEMMQAAPTELQVQLEKKKEALGRFWTARFAKETEVGADLRLYWAWNDGNGWQAPRNPRWVFRGRPFLYKLYISQETNPTAVQQADERTLEFMRQFLPEAAKVLFGRGSV